MKVFTVLDEKTEIYERPFFVPTTGAAIRAFTDILTKDSNHPFAQHPEDYTLFELGTYDEEKAAFELLPYPKSLGNGLDFVNTRE